MGQYSSCGDFGGKPVHGDKAYKKFEKSQSPEDLQHGKKVKNVSRPEKADYFNKGRTIRNI